MNDRDDEAWMLNRKDADTLELLREHLWESRQGAQSPSCLIAIGAAVDAIDRILDRDNFACSVQLVWENKGYFDDGRADGNSFDLALSDEGIMLGTTQYVEGDHHCETEVTLTEEGDFPHHHVRDWIDRCRQQDGTLRTSINWLEIN
jgi:hypothetical protein